jgi:phage protein D
MTTTTNGSIATFTVKINGSPLPDSVQVYDVCTTHPVNGIPKATLRILDGDPATGNFEASSSATFVPGNTISIEMGYDGTNSVVFNGIITAQEIQINETTGSMLEVACYDNAIKLTVENQNAIYTGQTDSDIMTAIISSYPGISANVTATGSSIPMRVQQNCSDWNFLLALADANGLVVTCNNTSITVFDPLGNTAPVLTIGYGNNLLAFNAKLNSINQYASVQAKSWDYIKQQQLSATATASYAGPGNLSSKTLAAVVGPADFCIQVAPSTNTDELALLAASAIKRSALAKIQGTAKTQGTALATAGAFLTLSGTGNRFNGDYFISGVTHDFSEGNWLTTITLGLPAEQHFIPLPEHVDAFLSNGVKISSGSLPQNSGSCIALDDTSKVITITDHNGNSVVLSAAGISLKSAKNISIEAGDQVILNGATGVVVKSTAGDFAVDALNINENAKMTYNATAAASLDINSSGEMKLQAAMIHIN